MSNLEQSIILPVVAADIGFFGTKFSWGRTKAGDICVDQFPSDVAEAPPTMWSTEEGGREGFRVVVDGASFFVGTGVENLVSTSGARGVRRDYSGSTEYKALLLGALASVAARHHANRVTIRHLILGLPMNTYFKDRDALQAMGRGPHRIPGATAASPEVVVEVLHVKVIPQPMGALLAHGEKHPGAGEQTTLVADMGGGTFDWFLAERLVPQVPRCGATPIGMLKCARDTCERILQGDADQPKLIARVDEALRLGNPTVNIRGSEVPLAPYLPQVEATVSRALTEMMKGVQSLDDVHAIYLTGGGAPLLARVAGKKFPKFADVMRLDEDPVFSNVRGFHLLGDQLHNAGR